MSAADLLRADIFRLHHITDRRDLLSIRNMEGHLVSKHLASGVQHARYEISIFRAVTVRIAGQAYQSRLCREGSPAHVQDLICVADAHLLPLRHLLLAGCLLQDPEHGRKLHIRIIIPTRVAVFPDRHLRSDGSVIIYKISPRISFCIFSIQKCIYRPDRSVTFKCHLKLICNVKLIRQSERFIQIRQDAFRSALKEIIVFQFHLPFIPQLINLP